MTILAGHLKCDCEKIGGSKCPDNLWPPSKAKSTYYHCPTESLDFLCDGCVRKDFNLDENNIPTKTTIRCISDGAILEERSWPQ